MKSKDKILIAPARSGSTWVCDLLSNTHDVIALDEPFERNVVQSMNAENFVEHVAQCFGEQRRLILQERKALSTRANDSGKIGNHYVDQRDGLRQRVVSYGEIKIEKNLSRDFILVLKHTIPFLGVVDKLIHLFPVFALTRNPLAILKSWNSINAAYRDGRIQPYAAQLTGNLNERLDLPDRLDRQLSLLEWHFERIRLVKSDHVVRYEELVVNNFERLEAIAERTVHGNAQRRRAQAGEETELLFSKIDKLPASSAIFYYYSKHEIERLFCEMMDESVLA